MKLQEGSNMDDLLVKQLLGETTEKEDDAIRVWLDSNGENQRYFDHFDLIWRQSKQLVRRSAADENAAWDRFKVRVENREEARVVPLRSNLWTGFWRIAAVFLVLLGVGWVVYFYAANDKTENLITKRTDQLPLAVTLPDHSIITLNRNSSISFPEKFSGDERPVTLHGEAFFSVTPEKAKPFIISVNDLTVRVVGTSFNIKESTANTEVIVETGLVEVSNQKQKIKIRPREQVTVSNNKQDLVKELSKDEFYNYYRTRKLVCNDTPLWRLVEILNEMYQTDITIENEQLKRLPINTTFDNQTLDEVLALISDTFGIKVDRSGKRIFLK